MIVTINMNASITVSVLNGYHYEYGDNNN